MATAHVTPEDFAILREACDALDDVGIPYVIGGGTAVVVYGRNRRTKDFDIFLNREVLRAAMDALARANFTTSDTEKRWLYKAWRDETLVDLIMEVRGGVRIDDEVMRRAWMVEQFGHVFRVMGPEDTVFRKAMTLTEGRPDWHDAISIIERMQGRVDWDYLLYRATLNPRRMLSFFLFAQTEMHAPPDRPFRSSTDNYLFTGEAPGPIPDWVLLHLIKQVWFGGEQSPTHPHRLEHLPRAA